MNQAVVPRSDLSHDLGRTIKRWGNVHAGNVHAGNVTAGDIIAGVINASAAAGGLKADIDSRATNSVVEALIAAHSWFELKRSTAYAAGDIVFSPHLPLWAYLECTTAGTTASAEPAFGSVAENALITDGTAIFIVRKVTTAQKIGTGTVGGNARPIWVSSGVPQASNANIGSEMLPVYMVNGALAACSRALNAPADGTISNAVGASNGYAKFTNGIILQWGTAKQIDECSYVQYKAIFPITFPVAAFSVAIAAIGRAEQSGVSSLSRSGFYANTSIGFSGGEVNEDFIPCYYLAVGM